MSGPGAVTFANANAASTTATFSSAGSYTLRLTASDSALSGSADLPVLVGGPLPSPWTDQDIGAVGTQGRGSFLTGTFIERGSGADIGGSADAFHYIYQPLNGNGTIIAHVATQYNSDPSAKAGVMIRETLRGLQIRSRGYHSIKPELLPTQNSNQRHYGQHHRDGHSACRSLLA